MGVGITLHSVRTFEFPFNLPLTTLLVGHVWWLDRASAFQQNLVYINEQNQAVIKVDNVSRVPFNEKRNSVFVAVVVSPDQVLIWSQIRITSQESYGVGSLWIIDLTHIPYGCSVPAFSDRA
jgi:hypothetical protein